MICCAGGRGHRILVCDLHWRLAHHTLLRTGADTWDAGSVLGTAYRDAAEAAAAARAQGLSVRDLPAAAGFASTRVSLLTAVLMAVALTFHSLLEVGVCVPAVENGAVPCMAGVAACWGHIMQL